MNKPHITKLKCFEQVAKVLGHSRAQLELWKVVHVKKCWWKDTKLEWAFCWRYTPQDYEFWEKVIKGINPDTGLNNVK